MTPEIRTDVQRQQDARRAAVFRERRRRGAMVVWTAVDPHQLAALERLALLEPGDRDPGKVGQAITRFLSMAPHVVAMGDALWPPAADA